MFIDVERGGDKVNINLFQLIINLDITLHRYPCSILSLDVQDIMGSHTVNVHGSLTKNKLDSNGRVIGQEIYRKAKLSHDDSQEEEEMPDIELVQKEIKNNEGCQVFGHFYVNKVPGNFHMSSHAYGRIIQQLASMGMLRFDVSHTINSLSFGENAELSKIRKNIKSEFVNPLERVTKDNGKGTNNKVYEYYLKVSCVYFKIVPSLFTDINNNSYFAYQYTTSSNEMISNMVPAIYFRYDLSPISVRFWDYHENFSHFFVQICAIIGGIFAMTGIMDSFIHKSVLFFLKQDSLDN